MSVYAVLCTPAALAAVAVVGYLMSTPLAPELLTTVPAVFTVGAVMLVAVNVVDEVRIGVQ